jgi:hypothetical protein
LAVRKTRIAVSVVLVLVLGGMCLADVGADPSENAELKARIEKLEKELAELKQIVKQQGETAKARPATTVSAKSAEAEPNIVKPVAEKKPVLSGLDVELYGRLKLDAVFDTSRMDTGNYGKWVRPDRGNNDHTQFDMTANESRLGLRVFGPKGEDIQTGGRVEIDFYGGGAENKSNPMIRHAYLTIDWPQDKFSILAGQTSDVISPLYPDTLNYTVGWWVGNIGYRRPQVRLTKSYMLDKDTELKLEGALARTMGRTNLGIPSADQADTGENAGMPSIQGRVSMTFPSLGYKPTTVGFSGHYGKEKYDTGGTSSTPATGSDKFDSWSLNLDVLQPVNQWLSFKGEMFTGENLDAYLGGIGQGVRNIGTTSSPIYDKEIASSGGWVEASLGPWGKWSFNVGVSADDADNDDLEGMSGDKREYNRSIFGNVLYDVDKNAQIGFELSQWHTEYQGADDADSLRAQTSFIYKF